MIPEADCAIFNALPKTVMATVHKDPDGDAIGSLLAFGTLMRQRGVDVDLYVPDNAAKFAMLPGYEAIGNKPKRSHYDWVVFLDCANLDRVLNVATLPTYGESINVDHHADNTRFATHNRVYEASSVGEIVYGLFQQLRVSIMPDTATQLYAAICYDTGNFRFSNTTADTFAVASDLVRLGADPSQISDWLFSSKPMSYFNDIRTGLTDWFVHPTKPYMIVRVSNGPQTSIESPVNFFRQLEGIELVVLCREVKHAVFKLSFRSKSMVDVSDMARSFEGGGHIRAAGGRARGTFESVKAHIQALADPLWT